MGGVSAGLLAVALGGVVYGVGGLRHTGVGVLRAAHVAQTAVTARSGSGSDAVLPSRASSLTPAATGPAPLPPSTPLVLTIPSVQLNAPLLGLGMDGKGAAELPPFSLPRTAGWLRDSASPGEAGTAVVVGHVDTTTGPAVFWNLAAVRPGAEVDVARLDGRTAVFTVDRVQEFPKTGFPTAQVYGPAPGAQLRVITCGGGYDRSKREYTGNVVLFAHLSGVR
ncbi:class F sortase [Streptacidiphilus melanogenes]|uniref:class F sortase n=1 Tax=Streptacidiphilus melanogenes TaxID=411235 RepID=UPI0005A7ECAA|nr:class F sortase [Streptacidiphilus melanogenes]